MARNRLVATLASTIVVVEASRRSGVRNTVAIAATLGNPVLVVPGPVTSAMSELCHDLLRTGEARIATTPDDVQHALNTIHTGPLP